MSPAAMQGFSPLVGARYSLIPLVVVLVSYTAFGQSARVEGVASNAITGEPIHGGKVSLCEAPHSKVLGPCVLTNTNQNGEFVFSGLPAGHCLIKGEAPGFLSDYVVLDGRGSAEFDLATEGTRAVCLKLWPAASISGHVVDETGRPMPGVSVAAISETYRFGWRHLERYQHSGGPSVDSTDKDGEFRIGEVRPGQYYVEAFFDSLNKPDAATLNKGYLPEAALTAVRAEATTDKITSIGAPFYIASEILRLLLHHVLYGFPTRSTCDE